MKLKLFIFFLIIGLNLYASNIKVYPNPYKPYDNNPKTGTLYNGTAGTGIYIKNVSNGDLFEVYDIRGKKLLKFNLNNISNNSYQWNVKRDNNFLKSGFYIIKITTKTEKFITKLVILK